MNYSILLPEPDSYKDVVLLWEKCFKRFWPDCPARAYWANEEENADGTVLTPVHYGGGNPFAFCGRLLKGVEVADTKYVLVWNADFIPTRQIQNEEVENVLQYMEKNGMKYCKLTKTPTNRMTKDAAAPYFYRYDPYRPYSISITFCIFDSEYLKSLILDPQWSGWQLEEYGLQLASQGKNTASIYYDHDIGHTVHLIVKSKVIPSAAAYLEKCGMSIDPVARPRLSNWEILSVKIRGVGSRLCPTKWRKAVKKIVNALGFKTTTKY